MPYILCPLCGALTHLSVRDHAAWYAERYPGVPFGTLVPGRCGDCWGELSEGDPVAIRDTLKHRTMHPARFGTITAIRSKADEGSVFEVALDSGQTQSLVRAELRKRREGET